ncbi:enoyl-CoA hydratase [Rhodococcus sp. 15-725-2-2b]|jgi:enoyl-CoA hydratase/carnithine racemase|uniref:enoyl-CoA hydratase/isomerase family protein n=1 Tax=unclassified Rhodococcus (in: high G+C Gram-positive bacteria) TaxID=192944 RepID=UPI000B9BC7E5|nr:MULTISPECIES: enoyl-CoA hydratase/isomerase family protein [unclassified Rhodococcus (in: high G+C Gram-positive bacteria)]OZC72573.1 enoyl-CoA hydratase [Rhodococcus sp. 06-469-3-2]OZD48799.1 enoyl-CoA hydratase [Rhodococcus sp. 06-1477-1A]OZE03312.1 enoyl-CoA hydratase [Rhodococcus sp. 05-2255-3C]OZE09699.1 enoyl-CoA hydratase [Rhodococcus sp. 05-2255-3B1]OZE14966.1 enoyl-CoA hydratase [Rhodococcus sp. 05-2255-2A2]
MTATVDISNDIAVLTLGDDENRFSPEWLETVDTHLTDIESNARGLITVGSGKFYSNGLDLEWLMSHGDRAEWYVGQVQALFNRILTFPLPTLAAVNGHTFGAGAMFAIAHDYRLMREDRGYYCFPEVDINIPFTPGMAALIQAKLSPQTATTAMTTGHRYGADEAVAAGLVDGTAPESELIASALDRLTPIAGKDRGTLGAIKTTMYASVSTALSQGRTA